MTLFAILEHIFRIYFHYKDDKPTPPTPHTHTEFRDTEFHSFLKIVNEKVYFNVQPSLGLNFTSSVYSAKLFTVANKYGLERN